MHDNCDGCSKDYDFDASKDILCIYLKNPECNHVLATCPHCERVTRIFIIPESVISVMEQAKLPIRMFANTPADVMEMFAELFGVQMAEEDSTQIPATPDPYAPPRDWLVQLHDDLRHFDHECRGGCDAE